MHSNNIAFSSKKGQYPPESHTFFGALSN